MKRDKLLKYLAACMILVPCVFFQYVYAGPSVFEFTFHNNTDFSVVVQQTRKYKNIKNVKMLTDTVLPGQDSTVFKVEQKNRKDALHNSWIITMRRSNNDVLCSSSFYFGVTHEGTHWRYGTLFHKYSSYEGCTLFKGTIDPQKNKMKNGHIKWQNSKLPSVDHTEKGNVRYYKMKIQLG